MRCENTPPKIVSDSAQDLLFSAAAKKVVSHMYTAEQYRAKAAEYRELLGDPRSHGEIRELRNPEQTHTTLVENEEPVVRNTGKVVSSPRYDIKPGSRTNRNKRAVIVGEHEHVLQCLGTAVMMRWSTLPVKLQRELFDLAGSLDDFDRHDSISELERTAKLKGRIARALHRHNGGQTQ
jgi:hypothetical protein